MLELTNSQRQIEFKKDNYGFLVSRRGTFAIQKTPQKTHTISAMSVPFGSTDR